MVLKCHLLWEPSTPTLGQSGSSSFDFHKQDRRCPYESVFHLKEVFSFFFFFSEVFKRKITEIKIFKYSRSHELEFMFVNFLPYAVYLLK